MGDGKYGRTLEMGRGDAKVFAQRGAVKSLTVIMTVCVVI